MTAAYLRRSLLSSLWYANKSNHTACLSIHTALKSITSLWILIICSLQDKHVDAFTDKVRGHVNSVIGLLLRHNKAEIRILGAHLLAQFEKVQVSLLSCPWLSAEQQQSHAMSACT